GQTDLVVGMPIAGRNRRELEGLIGFFVNTLALRVEAPWEMSFRELLGRVREVCLGAYAHQELPFEKLVDVLQPVRELARSPLFQVMFALQDSPPSLSLPGLSQEPLQIDPGMAKFDLTLFVRETASGWVALWEYSTDLFDEATVARMAAHYARLLECAVARPEQRLSELPLLSEAERHQMLVEWNATRREYPREACIHALFEAQARLRPEALAVAGKGRRLTYRELETRANQLAHHLRALGVGPEVVAGLCVERSVDFVVGALGILKAGGAYLPMDPAYPDEWLRYTAGDAGARVVVTQRALESRFEGAVRAVCLDGEDALARQSTQAPESGVRAENLAYVIYTSGSTGRPKGVGIAHRSLGNLVTWHQQAYEVTPDERASLVAGMAFDASVWELWSNITAGASVHIPEEEVRVSPKALLQWLAEERLTLGFLPTPMVEAALGEKWPEEMALRVLLTGGDALHRRPARGQKARMVNLYGPTENTVVSTDAAVESEGVEGVLPHIGRPIANVQAYILDERLEPVPMGVWGELHLGGENLARGYLGRAELTAERFLPNPFSEEPGARMYRTGDVVRLLPDGNLEFRGRRDAQVKVRGYRIELGEVEAALVSHPAVKEGVVVAREDVPGSKRLVAYYVGGAQTPEVSALRAYLGEKLPEHMVPSAFMRLEALPLTPNGKVDRKALPALEVTESEAYVAPRTAVEEVVAGIWASLLDLPRVGVHDNFFELGGHSLLATRVASRLQEVLRV
ncbi:MAG TPA: amino acid adenylation domain-containing protein, partial [Myxococcaceae bacterium]|nr:amino acid adenylation domain-containing protein [Myxococcaceae bacterium]